jgi:hypothetical protein
MLKECSGKPLWLIFLATAAVHMLVWLSAFPGMGNVRYGDYAPQVENLKAGRWMVDESGRVLHRYPPAYPLVLWGLEGLSRGTGLPLFGILAGFAAVCNAATAALVWGLGRALGLAAREAAAGAAVFGAHPFVLYGVLLPLSETPFMTVMCGSVLLALVGMRQASPKKLAAGGALAGLACLFRPIALLIPLVLGLAAAWFVKASRVRRAAAGLVVVTAAGAVLMPWVGWIRFRTGEWLMVSSGGPPTLRDGLSFNHKGFRERLDLPAGVKRLSDAAWEEYESLDSVGAYLGFVMRQAREDPLAVVQTYGYKAMRAWYGTDAQRKGVEQFNCFVSCVFLFAAGLGVFRLRRGGWPVSGTVLLAVAALFWGMATVALSIARYTTPAAAVLAPFAGAAVGGLRARR